MKGSKARAIIAKVCYGIGGVLLLCFVVRTVIDAVNYSKYMGSAPFEVFVLVNALWFVLPAVLVVGVGFLIHKVGKK